MMSKEYSTPYKDILKSLNKGLPCDNDESTTTEKLHCMSRNAEVALFHSQPFKQFRHYPFAPCTCTENFAAAQHVNHM